MGEAGENHPKKRREVGEEDDRNVEEQPPRKKRKQLKITELFKSQMEPQGTGEINTLDAQENGQPLENENLSEGWKNGGMDESEPGEVTRRLAPGLNNENLPEG